jgi:hypothetical protein
MLSQATAAEMKLVDPALHRWGFSSAQVTTTADPLVGGCGLLPRLPRSDRDLHRSRFRIDARSNDESAQRELAGSNLQ